MKKFIILLGVILLSLSLFSQGKYSHRSNDDFSKLSIGPGFGGYGTFILMDSSEAMLRFSYSVGINLKIRPVFPVSLYSGFYFNQITKTSKFYSAPIILTYYTQNNMKFSAGPIFNFDANGNKINFNQIEYGGMATFIKDWWGLGLLFIPKKLFYGEDLDRIKFTISLGCFFMIDFGIL